ncbi:NAD(P)-binding protein [Basidiobolus meristosporus CBS 931.73]|uniref:NAD(P)-binding protein n=1 Tax=Basidiobolus meristosporus CBS 931.73 TaxID=1314790 RepID=A0A1Y1XWX0_9FUNG|nr:NAD(P)-binding protein [Basidiobolus meristosporus CBS 931.73]|eukprot:ORX90222.1 NAD(P)-binding protein [Basidiobolus meristosporus CBS 931.73]
MTNKLVCVTGGTGYLASKLIEALLEQGYRVRTTVRSLNNYNKVAPLQGLTSKGDLSLFEADLLSEGSFKEAIDGCECVFHTASPVITYNLEDPVKQLIEPAIKGTRNIIQEAIACASVSTVILTSSVAAVKSNAKPEDYVFTEEDWNDSTSTQISPYALSKTLAELEAWKLVEGSSVRLVSINPSYILGPSVGIHPESESITRIISTFDGSYLEKGAPPISMCTVDLRNVVEAHIRAFENHDASGRYIVSSEESTTVLDWVKILSEDPEFEKHPFPTKLADGKPTKLRLDPSKAQKELGIELIPLQESLLSLARFLKKSGVIKNSKK